MADQDAGQKKEDRPTTGFYIFAGLVLVTLVIIVGYVIRSYFAG
jgi:hypothetical protein